MKAFFHSVATTIGAGLLVVVPVYLAVLLLLKAMQSLSALVKPVARLIPESVAAEGLVSVLLILAACFLVGLLMRTWGGRALRGWLEHALFEKLPGYSLFRSLTMRLAGKTDDLAWKPALAEIEEALVPAFIIEELSDGRYTVFVPSVPTPLAGAVYVLTSERVHPVNIGFAQAIRAVSRWGAGCSAFVAAMEDTPHSPSSGPRAPT
ncbi:MAG TPA: DUF502 domain-containing protein [Steroidobacteraceae bacterium]|nr:DUF502 domain-containing protein [Steroidobacteraceae bacterium]